MTTTIISSADSAGLALTSASSVTVTNTGTLTGAVHDTTSNPNLFYSAIFANSSAPLYLSNAGTISGPNYTTLGTFANGLDLRAGGTIVNQQNGVIEGHGYGYGVFINAPTTAPVLIENAGTIESPNNAVAIEDSGTVVLTNSSTGIILSKNYGLFLQAEAAATVVNNGHITSTVNSAVYLSANNNFYFDNAVTGTIIGTNDGLLLSGRYNTTSATVVNAGLVEASGNYALSLGVTDTGTVINLSTGTISGGTSGVQIGANLSGTTDMLINDGVITGTIGVYFLPAGPVMSNTVTNAGTITGTGGEALAGGNGGLHLDVVAGAVFNGSVVAAATIATYNYTTNTYVYSANTLNVLELNSSSSAGTLSGIGSAFQNFSTIEIDSQAAWTVGGDAQGLANGETILGFTNLDTLELTGFAATSEHYANNALTLTNGSQTEIIHIVETNATSADFTLTASGGNSFITTDIACFYPGTRIATPDGERAVEELAAGDLLMTAAGPAALRWVAHSEVSLRFADPLRALPVRIAAGALGEGLPQRDLLVSPDHALFIDGLLVQAGALVGLPGISRAHKVPVAFRYYHLELEAHELLLAEGVLTESFLDETGWGTFANWVERPARAAPMRELPFVRVKSARQLPARLRATLQRSAAA